MASRRSYSTVFRIVSKRYPPFDGGGAFRFGSRWISPGRRVVHAAESYALAVLENLVHWQKSRLPPTLVCVPARVPDSIEQEELVRSAMPAEEDLEAFREIGDDWYDRAESCILWVPSVISPVEHNVLLNQEHQDFAQVRVGRPIAVAIDPRLLRA